MLNAQQTFVIEKFWTIFFDMQLQLELINVCIELSDVCIYVKRGKVFDQNLLSEDTIFFQESLCMY